MDSETQERLVAKRITIEMATKAIYRILDQYLSTRNSSLDEFGVSSLDDLEKEFMADQGKSLVVHAAETSNVDMLAFTETVYKFLDNYRVFRQKVIREVASDEAVTPAIAPHIVEEMTIRHLRARELPPTDTKTIRRKIKTAIIALFSAGGGILGTDGSVV